MYAAGVGPAAVYQVSTKLVSVTVTISRSCAYKPAAEVVPAAAAE